MGDPGGLKGGRRACSGPCRRVKRYFLMFRVRIRYETSPGNPAASGGGGEAEPIFRGRRPQRAHRPQVFFCRIADAGSGPHPIPVALEGFVGSVCPGPPKAAPARTGIGRRLAWLWMDRKRTARQAAGKVRRPVGGEPLPRAVA